MPDKKAPAISNLRIRFTCKRMVPNKSNAPVKADNFSVCNGSISWKASFDDHSLSGRCDWCDKQYTGTIS